MESAAPIGVMLANPSPTRVAMNAFFCFGESALNDCTGENIEKRPVVGAPVI